MKKILPYTILMFSLAILSACSGNSSGSDFSEQKTTKDKSIQISIEGMSCMACVAKVKKTLLNIDGVKEVKVSLQEKNTEINYNSMEVTPEQLKSAINKIGYKTDN